MQPGSEFDETLAQTSAASGDAACSDPRQHVLNEAATTLGVMCAAQQRQALQADGHRISGGWPATVSEVRAWVNANLISIGGPQTIGVVTETERDLLTRTVYASARKEWLRFALPEER